MVDVSLSCPMPTPSLGQKNQCSLASSGTQPLRSSFHSALLISLCWIIPMVQACSNIAQIKSVYLVLDAHPAAILFLSIPQRMPWKNSLVAVSAFSLSIHSSPHSCGGLLSPLWLNYTYHLDKPNGHLPHLA